jgi:hypothetical protein
MSPFEMTAYRDRFDKACAKLGWKKVEVTEQHERDWDCSWKETVWLSATANRLFSENDLEEGMVNEIIRIAGV